MSLIGIQYKQPRVFGHDAWPVVIGAINYTWNLSTKFPSPLDWAGIKVTNAGNGGANPYVEGDEITLSAGSGSVPGVLIVDAVDSDGLVTDFSFDPSTASNLGVGYVVGDSLTQAGTTSAAGTGFECDVTNTDIPNTQYAGCCIYVGDVTVGGTLTVTMESENEATFNGIAAGSFLPILIKRVEIGDAVGPPITLTTASSLLALY